MTTAGRSVPRRVWIRRAGASSSAKAKASKSARKSGTFPGSSENSRSESAAVFETGRWCRFGKLRLRIKPRASGCCRGRPPGRNGRKTNDVLSRVICPGGVGFETSAANWGTGRGAGFKFDATSHAWG
jgi:hypothetical protein